MEIRRLNNDDISMINDIQSERGYNCISSDYFNSFSCEWAIYAAIECNRIISICGVFPYRRFPHDDYSFGYIAEIGAIYTTPKYRNEGIGHKVLDYMFAHVKNDIPLLDALVADATEDGYNILKNYGFVESTEHRIWMKI